ncbi:tetrapyrrole biosynthesis, porphobilinogen synthase [Rozella allomycis CSF55]|uniref:Delta-aminolevulinic acid dehydratase n=1 Tax=Rozella allomycis (strain CSF55) TaxID=988480 RepID=A0A075AQU1_ROZAC|nr:Aldolase-type TIM barrel domain-containing protein [Rozella allomycis CSF55]RKP16146.1 tetrapyrrole biosynthesis, porphobilinogen synthase [Rozella allomycis CSF55]|eukprot:EPZ32550.1 Aldolase-type TIM barrel domain-containing protein [Rozella allomycis CSF55]
MHQTIHQTISHHALLKWYSPSTKLIERLIYPVFVSTEENCYEDLMYLPGQKRIGTKRLYNHLKPLVDGGLQSIILFISSDSIHKDEEGSFADDSVNPVIKAIGLLKEWFPRLLIACDVCVCAYTSHGHCGLTLANGNIDNSRSIKRLADIALAYAQAGCDVVAPSDMMDNRVMAIKEILRANSLSSTVSILSYAAKFHSSLYTPFRKVSSSSPLYGDRSKYQLPFESHSVAMKSIVSIITLFHKKRDIEEGADFIIVKPGLFYLDIVCKAKELFPFTPVAVYQVSGEYAAIYHASKAGILDLDQTIHEYLSGCIRAGASMIITYFVPQIIFNKNHEY